MSSLPTFTEEEVASHNTSESLWVSIEGKVYDITPFQDSHPGGRDVLLDNAGKDATSAFAGVGHSDDAVQMREGNYLIGTLEGYVPEESAETEQPATATTTTTTTKKAETIASTTARAGAGSSGGSSCCSGQQAARLAALAVGVAAVCIGIYFAYKKLKK